MSMAKTCAQKILCVSLGMILVISGLLKAINIHSFSVETGDFIDFYMPQWMHGWNMPCAIGICVFEMCLGLWALKINYIRIVSLQLFALFTFFVYLTGINAFYPSLFGSVESCGCFGELIHFSPIASFIKSVLLWIVSFLLILMEFSQKSRYKWEFFLADKYIHFTFVVSWILPLYSLCFFNKMSQGLYVIIYCLLACFAAGLVIFERRW